MLLILSLLKLQGCTPLSFERSVLQNSKTRRISSVSQRKTKLNAIQRTKCLSPVTFSRTISQVNFFIFAHSFSLESSFHFSSIV